MNTPDFPPFRPHPLAPDGHTQTVLAAYYRPVGIPYRAVRHEVVLPDGDSLVVHDDRPAAWREGERVVLLVHGLAGCHGSPYLVRTADKLNQRGVRTFRMDLRGMGAAQHQAQHLAHAGRSRDVEAAVHRVGELCPQSPISLVGFSMGGNLVLKLLGQAASQPPRGLDSALAIAPPIDLAHCARALERGPQRLYSKRFTRMLLKLIRQRPQIASRIPEVLAAPPRGLWEFDDRITAPLSGFRSAEEYYADSSAAAYLGQVRLPTLILAAADDPVVPVDMFPAATISETTSLLVVPRGGHVGFLGRRDGDPDRWWLDWRIVQWVRGLGV